MYTKLQKEIIAHTKRKVADLFKKYPVKAHKFDHTERVARWAVKIAKAEKADVFLCEMAAWLHDVGHIYENKPGQPRGHHEFSYRICRSWFRQDAVFQGLCRLQKLTLLYAARYHWNNVADKYETAWILRDADKLDLFGKVGLKRIFCLLNHNREQTARALRYTFDYLYWLRTKTAKRFVKKQKFLEPLVRYYAAFLKSRIKPVKL